MYRSIDDVENTMDDIREQMDIANEITEAIAQPVGFGIEFDDVRLWNVFVSVLPPAHLVSRTNWLPSWKT
jgi:hypothetical protein